MGNTTSVRTSRSKGKARSAGPPRGGPSNRGPARGGPPTRKQGPSLSSQEKNVVKGGMGDVTAGGSAGVPTKTIAGGGVSLAGAREQANQLNEEGRNTLDAFKPSANLAKKASAREQAARQNASRAQKMQEAAKGKAASLAGAKDAYQTARELRNIQKHGLSKEGIAAARRAAVAATWAALDQAAKALAAETLGLSVVAYQAIRHWRVTLTIIIIALLLIFFIIFDDQVFDAQQQQDMTPTTSDTCNPAQFANQDAFGKTSVCTITVTYNGGAQDITITDTLLPGTDFVSADHNGTYDKASNTVTWDAQKLNLPLDPVNITVTVTIRITTHQNDTIVYNAYSINPVGLAAGGGGTVAGNVPANNSTCGGKYNLTSPLKNFGDPQCDFTVQQLGAQLRNLDPAHAVIWDCMASHESGYDPDAYNPNSTSGSGAYGLFQMNPPGKGNNQYDNGGVNWSLQISNAINYNKTIGGSFAYWATYAGCH